MHIWTLSMSDGFYRAVDTFHVIAEDRIVAWAMDQGLATILAAVRRLEAGDAECIRYPRFKPQDDATALLFEMRSASLAAVVKQVFMQSLVMVCAVLLLTGRFCRGPERPRRRVDHPTARNVSTVISGGTPRRTGSPNVPRPRFTYRKADFVQHGMTSEPAVCASWPNGRRYSPATNGVIKQAGLHWRSPARSGSDRHACGPRGSARCPTPRPDQRY